MSPLAQTVRVERPSVAPARRAPAVRGAPVGPDVRVVRSAPGSQNAFAGPSAHHAPLRRAPVPSRAASPPSHPVPGHLLRRGRPVVPGGRDLLGNPVASTATPSAAGRPVQAAVARASPVPLRPVVARQVFFERVPAAPRIAGVGPLAAPLRVRSPPAWRSALFYVGLLGLTFGVHAAYYL